MARHRFLSHQRLQTTASLEAPRVPMEARTCRPWAGNHLANRPSHLPEPMTMATSTPSRSIKPRTACTTSTTTSAAQTAPNQTTTTLINSGWVTKCGLLPFNRRLSISLGVLERHPSIKSDAMPDQLCTSRQTVCRKPDGAVSTQGGIVGCQFHL